MIKLAGLIFTSLFLIGVHAQEADQETNSRFSCTSNSSWHNVTLNGHDYLLSSKAESCEVLENMFFGGERYFCLSLHYNPVYAVPYYLNDHGQLKSVWGRGNIHRREKCDAFVSSIKSAGLAYQCARHHAELYVAGENEGSLVDEWQLYESTCSKHINQSNGFLPDPYYPICSSRDLTYFDESGAMQSFRMSHYEVCEEYQEQLRAEGEATRCVGNTLTSFNFEDLFRELQLPGDNHCEAVRQSTERNHPFYCVGGEAFKIYGDQVEKLGFYNFESNDACLLRAFELSLQR